MKYVPKSLTRFGSRSVLKVRKNSPTILVVAGVVGFGATVIMAAKAAKHVDPVIEDHKAKREALGDVSKNAPTEVRREHQVQLTQLYVNTGARVAKIYGPTVVVGTLSAASILWGHKILSGRHVATMAAYSGLMEQFNSYRDRVRKTLGEGPERDIYNGAHGEYVEDPDHKGEYKMQPVFDKDESTNACRRWFDETNAYFTKNPASNKMWLTGVQSHMNDLLQLRGHLFLNDVLDALHMPRCAEGQQLGWLWEAGTGDDFVDFGFMTSHDPHTTAFRNGVENTVRLNFNVDGIIWDMI